MATVVGALLVLAALVSFLVVYNVEWAPVFIENREGEASARLQAAIIDWGSTGENFVANGFANRSFSETMPVGATTNLFVGSQRSTGTVALEDSPSLTVFRDGTQVARVTGSLRVNASYARYPQQTMRYTFGAFELTQESSTWVDMRSVLSAQRGAGGTLTVSVQAIGVSGAPQSQGGGAEVEVVGLVESAASPASTAGTVRLLVENVRADAWRAAFTRVLSAAALTGETAANCPASAQNRCLQTGTNTATTADLYLRNVAGGWTTVWGTVRAELRV